MTLLALAVLLAPGQLEPAWERLFNGHDLSGWTPKITHHPAGENFANTFRVEGGVLKVSYDGYGGKFDGRFGHLFYKTPFSNYKLRLEYRFVGNQIEGGPGWAFRNSGIMIHGQDPATMRLDQDFPVSSEVQLLGGSDTGERTTGNVCTPGTNIVMDGQLVTRHCTDSQSPTFRGDAWVKCEVEVHGYGLVIHRIDGKEVLRYEQIQYDPNDADGKALIHEGKLRIDGGTISLQSESHPMEFRNIEIMRLAK